MKWMSYNRIRPDIYELEKDSFTWNIEVSVEKINSASLVQGILKLNQRLLHVMNAPSFILELVAAFIDLLSHLHHLEQTAAKGDKDK